MSQPLVLADYAVWRRLVAALGESGLHRLAMGDDGYGFDQNLAILRELAATGRVPRPLLWEPCEALALIMHSRGEPLGAEDAADILVCTMVLSSAYWYQSEWVGEADNITTAMLHSVLALGEPWASELLLWLRDLVVALFTDLSAGSPVGPDLGVVALAGLVLAATLRQAPAERGWWRARVAEVQDRLGAVGRDLWSDPQWAMLGWCWRQWLEPVRAELVGFCPPGWFGRDAQRSGE